MNAAIQTPNTKHEGPRHLSLFRRVQKFKEEKKARAKRRAFFSSFILQAPLWRTACWCHCGATVALARARNTLQLKALLSAKKFTRQRYLIQEWQKYLHRDSKTGKVILTLSCNPSIARFLAGYRISGSSSLSILVPKADNASASAESASSSN